MSYNGHKNLAVEYFGTAAKLSDAAHFIRARASGEPATEIGKSRAALLNLAANILELDVTTYTERGIREWYEAFPEAQPQSASSDVGSKHPG